MRSSTRRESSSGLDDLRIFSGGSLPDLVDGMVRHLGVAAAAASIDSFPDGETTIKIEDDVRGKDCFVVQSTCPPVNDTLMELLIFIDSLRRASADRITAVIPYFGYARQDRKSEGRTPITAKLVANMLVTAGVDRVLTMDLHAAQLQGFFDIPVDHLTAVPVLGKHFRKLKLDNTVLLSPDVGNLKTANKYLEILGGELAIVDKRRRSGSETTAASIIGDVSGKTVLIFDDMITTGGTAAAAARLAREQGAVDVCLGATHAVFAEPAIERIGGAEFKHLVVTDTIPLPGTTRGRFRNLEVLSVADLMGEAVRRIHQNLSISALFSEWSGAV
jgi:ribose-phosphate pyrophosphokinase